MTQWEHGELFMVFNPHNAANMRVEFVHYSIEGVGRSRIYTPTTADGDAGAIVHRMFDVFDQQIALLGTQGWEMIQSQPLPALQAARAGAPPGGGIESWHIWFKRPAGAGT